MGKQKQTNKQQEETTKNRLNKQYRNFTYFLWMFLHNVLTITGKRFVNFTFPFIPFRDIPNLV